MLTLIPHQNRCHCNCHYACLQGALADKDKQVAAAKANVMAVQLQLEAAREQVAGGEKRLKDFRSKYHQRFHELHSQADEV